MNNIVTFSGVSSTQLEATMEKTYATAFGKVLEGTGISAQRFARMGVSLIMGNTSLQNCERTSVLRSLMTVAQLGLEPDNVLGQAYLVPFKGKATVIVGYKGYVRLADNAGYSVEAHIVRKLDKFDYAFGLNPRLDHVPSDAKHDATNPITHVYAIATHRASGHKIPDVMKIEEVNAIRDRSEGYKAAKKWNKPTMWEGPDYEMMVKKTILRRISSRLPIQVQRAAMVDDMAERGREVTLDKDTAALQDVTQDNMSNNQPETLPGMDDDAAAAQHAGNTVAFESDADNHIDVTPEPEAPRQRKMPI